MNQFPRLSKLQSRLTELQCDAFLVTDPTNVRYLTGFTGDSTFAWVGPSSVTLLSDGRYQTQLSEECPGVETSIRPPSMPMHQLVVEHVSALKVKRLGLESAGMSLAVFMQLERAFADVGLPMDFVKTGGVIEALREVKDPTEIMIIRKAVDVAQNAFEQTVADLKPTQTELDFAQKLEWAMREDAAEGVSFDIIVAFGGSGALPHYHPSDRALGNEPTVLVDWGAKVDGYASDITRTFHRVCPDGVCRASDRFRRCYEAVLEAQLASIEALRPGVTGREVDEIARQVLKSHGLEEAFLHSLGHGIGLQIHEGPRLASTGEKPLEAGMVVTVEPGVYFEGDFGIRIEDDVLITPDGAEVLSSLAKGLDDCRLML